VSVRDCGKAHSECVVRVSRIAGGRIAVGGMKVSRENAKMTREIRKNNAKITRQITLNNAKLLEILRPTCLHLRGLLPRPDFLHSVQLACDGSRARGSVGQAPGLRRPLRPPALQKRPQRGGRATDGLRAELKPENPHGRQTKRAEWKGKGVRESKRSTRTRQSAGLAVIQRHFIHVDLV
jgi:hypothetical protein